MSEESTYNTASFDALRALVASQPRMFSLNLAVCSTANVRSNLTRQLHEKHQNIEVVSFWPYSANIFEHVHEQIEEGPRDSIFIFGLDDAISSDNFNLAAKSWFDPISSAQLAYPTLV